MYRHSADSHRDEDSPQTSQFSLRVTIVGAIALGMFSIIFLRLWYLEVLSGDRYLARANDNQVREVEIQAPRGEIVDRNGEVLVGNRSSLSLQLRLDEMPPPGAKRTAIFERLADATRLDVEEIRREIDEQTQGGTFVTPVTLLRDVSYALAAHVRERPNDFPGVSVDEVYVRSYPNGTLGAHLFGFVNEIGPEELKEPRYSGLVAGDLIGKAGIEDSYDQVLRGTDGFSRIQVNAAGEPTGRTLGTVEPVAGNDLRLTIDSELQAVGEGAIGQFGLPAAFVAMDVDSGEILGMGSAPTFDPAIYTQPSISEADFDFLYNEEVARSLNRAMQSPYPTGSTFKLVTAIAALQSGHLDLGETIVDGGCITFGDREFCNAGDPPAVHGTIELERALQVSSDVFFYTLGGRMDESNDPDNPLQRWTQLLNVGIPTGIDVPGEFAGLIPTPEWRNELYALAQEPDSPCGVEISGSEECTDPKNPFETDRPWTIGDNVNFSIGQGDLQATPLQMAVAYAALANGGKIVRPHVGLRVEDQTGRVIQEVNPAPRRTLNMRPEYVAAILSGLQAAAMEPEGTSYSVFGGFPEPVCGKTGTAETASGFDQSWYVALAPCNDPEVVVSVTIERGGFGVDAAAPAARTILESYFDLNPSQIDEVEGTGILE